MDFAFDDDVSSLQILLRNQAGLHSYNPKDDAALPNLPSLEDSISQIDPSPPYLRCKSCNGRLLRGVNSIICVFCGRGNDHTAPPEPLKFTSTSGYRWFLHSLGLSGSELVGLPANENESNRVKTTAMREIPLSDLLGLEIVWPSESEKSKKNVAEMTPDQRLRTLNFAGAYLDDFFGESKNVDSVSLTFLEQKKSLGDSGSVGGGGIVSQGRSSVSLFENVEPVVAAASSGKVKEADSFSGWEADFQSAGQETWPQELKSDVPAVDFGSVDLSAHMDSVFGPVKDLSGAKTEENVPSTSNNWFDVNNKDGVVTEGNMNDPMPDLDWFEGNQRQATSGTKVVDNKNIDGDDDSFDAWNDFSSSTSSKQAVKYMQPPDEHSSEINYSGDTNKSPDIGFGSFSENDLFSGTFGNQSDGTQVNTLHPITSPPSNRVDDVDWFGGNQWQKESGVGVNDNKNIDADDDSFDAWNDFTSSTTASKQSAQNTQSVVEQSSEMNLFGETNNKSPDFDFGCMTGADFFSGTSSNKSDATPMNILQSDTPVSDRVFDMNPRHGETPQVFQHAQDIDNLNTSSKADDLEMLMSQMHDLSFMLKTSLSIPQKDGST